MSIVDLIDEENDLESIMSNAYHANTHERTPEQMTGARYKRDLKISPDIIHFFVGVYHVCK